MGPRSSVDGALRMEEESSSVRLIEDLLVRRIEQEVKTVAGGDQGTEQERTPDDADSRCGGHRETGLGRREIARASDAGIEERRPEQATEREPGAQERSSLEAIRRDPSTDRHDVGE